MVAKSDVNVCDRLIGQVRQLIATVGHSTPVVRVKRDVQLDVGNGGLRQAFVFQIFPLIFGKESIPLVERFVTVENVGVVISVSAGCREC